MYTHILLYKWFQFIFLMGMILDPQKLQPHEVPKFMMTSNYTNSYFRFECQVFQYSKIEREKTELETSALYVEALKHALFERLRYVFGFEGGIVAGHLISIHLKLLGDTYNHSCNFFQLHKYSTEDLLARRQYISSVTGETILTPKW